jgi:hypothetical protein
MEAKMEKGKVPALGMVLTIFWVAGLLWGLPELSGEKLEKTEELRREIKLLNLMNGLDLRQGQMEIILASAKESQRLMARFEHILRNSQEETEEVLEEIRRYLRENVDIPSQTVQKYHRLDREIREERLKIQSKMKGLAREVEECLEPHQLYQLREFVPCIIPPQGEKRIGQAYNYKGWARALERVRRVPSYLYQQRKEEIVSRTLQGLKLHAPPFSDGDDEAMKRHIETIYEDVRNLEDEEFEIQKEHLAEKLISPFKPEIPFGNVIRKIAGFLLSEEVITVLEERLNQGDPKGEQVS